MALRLTKTSKIIFAISIVVLSGALGYLVWRVNQEERLDPTEGDAADCNIVGCPSGCYCNKPTGKCTGEDGCWWECVDGTRTLDATGGCATNGGYIPGFQCDACVPDSDEPPTSTYDTRQACQSAADAANEGDDPDWYTRPNSCPITLEKWICTGETAPFTLTRVACDHTLEVNCGTEPTSYPFNKAPTTDIGPFLKDGEVILYYTSLLDSAYRPALTFSYKDHNNNDVIATKTIKMPALSSNRARVETNIMVKAGDTITLVKSDDDRDQGDPECAPDESVNPKYISWGWIAPSGGECGSGLAGPPTNGISDDPMDKVAVLTSSYNSWVQAFGDEPVVSTNGSQCWADWREWPGDYDFNDYFLQIAYVSEEVVVEENEPVWDISKSVVESCLDEGTEDPVAQLTYTITVRNTGDGDGTIEKITDDLDSKVLASFVQTGITSPGTYSNGNIVWDYTGTPLNIAAGSTKTYTYTMLVDKDSFGVYGNTVTLDPSVGENITATASIDADCEILIPEDPEEPEEPVVPGEPTPEETIPETGIFDSTVGRVSVGLILVILGGIVYSMPSGIFRIEKNTYKYRERFERKVANK